MCVSDSTMVELRSDSSDGPLDQNVVIRARGGSDNVWMVQTNGYDPPASCDCGVSDWYKMDYDGYYLDIYGEGGGDTLQGAVDDGDTYVTGGGGNDICYNYSTIGRLFGSSGYDDLVSDTTGSSDELNGNGENDCLWDTSNSVRNSTAFDCGSGGNDFYHQDNASIEYQCEESTDCCGVC